MGKKKYYAVARGRKPGIYYNWEDTKKEVNGFSNPEYKGFLNLEEAKTWLFSRKNSETQSKERKTIKNTEQINRKIEKPIGEKIIIYTDGACKNNPGPGGYGVLLINCEKQKELSDGFRLTTNNRMELLACIIGLESLKKKSVVNIYSDSAYVVNSVNKGWVDKWKKNRWKRNKTDYADNIDLWERFLEIYSKHQVKMNWVKGHANNPGNERCDELASNAAEKNNLKIDHYYEEKIKK